VQKTPSDFRGSSKRKTPRPIPLLNISQGVFGEWQYTAPRSWPFLIDCHHRLTGRRFAFALDSKMPFAGAWLGN
jgi:hypothetical protein